MFSLISLMDSPFAQLILSVSYNCLGVIVRSKTVDGAFSASNLICIYHDISKSIYRLYSLALQLVSNVLMFSMYCHILSWSHYETDKHANNPHIMVPFVFPFFGYSVAFIQ